MLQWLPLVVSVVCAWRIVHLERCPVHSARLSTQSSGVQRVPGDLSVWRDVHFIQLVYAHKFCAGSGLKGWRAEQTSCVYSFAHNQGINFGQELRIRRLLTSFYQFTTKYYCHPLSLFHADIMSLIFPKEHCPCLLLTLCYAESS